MTIESPFKNIPLPEDNELIAHYQPKFLGMGGDHIVYEAEGHPNVVIKASTYNIKDLLSEEKTKDFVATEVSTKNDQIREFRTFWGKEHTVPERRYLMQVPISKDLLDEVFKKDHKYRVPPKGYESLKEVWTSVIVQEIIPEIKDPEHKSLNFGVPGGGFVEIRFTKKMIDQVEYEELNNAFIFHPNNSSQQDLVRFFEIQDHPKARHLKDIIDQAEGDNELKESLKKFVLQSIEFATKTGNILALAGEDNVIFYKKDGNWDYLLVDAIPVHSEPVFKTSREILDKVALGEKIDDDEKDLLMKGLNFTRTINGLAKSLGLDEYLEIISQGADIKNINFSDIYKK